MGPINLSTNAVDFATMPDALSRRQWLAGAALLATGAASAQTYPDKTRAIQAICPYGSGTSTDLLARAVGRAMADLYGINLVVDNRVGADGVIGMQAAKTAAADGYHMVFTSISTQVVNPHMYKQLNYNPLADFIPIGGVARTPLMLNFGPSTPFKTAREFIAAAKANPGKYTFGSGTTTTRLVGELLQQSAGITLMNVPYKLLTDAMTNLAGGQIDLVIVDPGTAGPFYKQGVRPVATTVASRVPQYPDVPTLQEEGLAGFDVGGWFAAYFPVNTPPAMVNTMREMLDKSLQSKYVADVYRTFSMEPFALTGDQLVAFQRQELQKWGAAVRAAGLEGKL